MRSRFALAVCLSAASALAAPRPAAPAVTREQIDEAVKKLKANAQLWLKDEPIGDADKADLKGLKLDKDSVSLLEPLLKAGGRDPVDLYAIHRLLSCLDGADAETAKAILPAVKALDGRLRSNYVQFPQVTKQQAQLLKMPDFDPRLTTEIIMGRMAVVEKNRQAKIERDMPIAKQNEAIYGIGKQALRLQLRADDPKEDADLIKTMLLEERKGTSIFLLISDAIGDEAKRMSQDRAGKLYGQLRQHVPRLATQAKRNYANPGKADLRLDDTSAFGKEEEYAGVQLIKTLNRVAEAAKNESMPKLKVPDKKQIDEINKKR